MEFSYFHEIQHNLAIFTKFSEIQRFQVLSSFSASGRIRWGRGGRQPASQPASQPAALVPSPQQTSMQPPAPLQMQSMQPHYLHQRNDAPFPTRSRDMRTPDTRQFVYPRSHLILSSSHGFCENDVWSTTGPGGPRVKTLQNCNETIYMLEVDLRKSSPWDGYHTFS